MTWKLSAAPDALTSHSHAGPAGASGDGFMGEAGPRGTSFLTVCLMSPCRSPCVARGGLLLPGRACGEQCPAGLCGPWRPGPRHPLDQRWPPAPGQPAPVSATEWLADHPQDRGKAGPGALGWGQPTAISEFFRLPQSPRVYKALSCP